MARTSATARKTAERNARQRAAAARAAAQRKQRRRRMLTLVGSVVAVVAVVVGLVVAALVSSGDSGKNPPAAKSADAAARTIATIPVSTINTVGKGTSTGPLKPVQDPALTADGKPLVLYVGAEFCPYCAAERWSLVQAMSRFGSFSGLTETHSSPRDTFANTPTFSFHGSGYASDILAFSGRELQDADGALLETPTKEEAALWHKYTGTPGTYPFIDIGGRYVSTLPSYDPSVLSGLSMNEIATAMTDPSSDVAKAVLGAANRLTAAICRITDQKPASVCSAPGVQGAQGGLGG